MSENKKTCGDFGGVTNAGEPCKQPVDDGPCYRHRGDDSELTERERRFVEAYMGAAKGNGTEAYKIAGYTWANDNVAAAGAARMLTRVKIKKAIDERVEGDPLVADREELQRFFTAVMRGLEWEGDGPAKMKDRLRAAELLGKTRAEFKEQVDITSDGDKLDVGPIFILPDNGRGR